MKKFFTALLIVSFIFYQVPVFAVDETAPDISQASPEIPPEDGSEEAAPPSQEEGEPPSEEEPPPEEAGPENPEENPDGEDVPEGEAPPEGEPVEGDAGEEIPPENLVDLSEITGLMEQNFLSIYEEISTIRKSLDIIICFIIPVFCAVLVVYKVIAWFYSTFIKDAL